MDENRKSQSPIAWVLGQTGDHGGQYVQTGDHGGQYVLSVTLAVIGVAFSVAPYFVVVGIVQGLMEGQQDFAFYLGKCLIMAALWMGRVLFHALSTATSHRATFAVLGEIRKRCTEKLARGKAGPHAVRHCPDTEQRSIKEHPGRADRQHRDDAGPYRAGVYG